MPVSVTAGTTVAFRSEPHRWQTSIPAQITRRVGRRWVIGRHVRNYCRPLTIEGGSHLRSLHGPAIIIANHSSHFDTPIVLSTLPERIRRRTAVGAAADRFYRRGKRTWWYSLFFNTFPVVRGGGSGSLDYARELLARGWSVVIFPEGTRSSSGELGRLRHGVSILAIDANVPVVPVHVQGAHQILPKGERSPRPAAVRVHVGAPVWLDDHPPVAQATERLENALLRLGDRQARAA